MHEFIQFKKEKKIIYNHHCRFQKTSGDGPKSIVVVTITISFNLKTDNDNYIFKKNQKIVPTPLGSSVDLRV